MILVASREKPLKEKIIQDADIFPANFQTSCVFQVETGGSNTKGQISKSGLNPSSVWVCNTIEAQGHSEISDIIHGNGRVRCVTSIRDMIGLYEISLKKKPTSASFFKIFPSLKMRQEGEIVFLEDTIELQSRITSHFVNFSKKKDINYRLVGKTAPRGWKIKPFSRSDEQQDSDMSAIRAGDFCRLFHR